MERHDPRAPGDRLLASLADEAEAEPAWSGYAAYARHRLRGLRRPAMAALEAFVAEAAAWPDEERRRLTAWLCGRLEAEPVPTHDATPHPLVEGVLLPTLERWADEPGDARPHGWLGLLFGTFRNGAREFPVNARARLRTAIALDPEGQAARVRLVELLLDNVHWDTHHLPDAYLGQPDETIAALDEAAALGAGVRDAAARASLEEAIAHARQLVEDWIDYGGPGGADFVDWCRERGRAYDWVRHYHYPP